VFGLSRISGRKFEAAVHDPDAQPAGGPNALRIARVNLAASAVPVAVAEDEVVETEAGRS
jgi:hypothetical protein